MKLTRRGVLKIGGAVLATGSQTARSQKSSNATTLGIFPDEHASEEALRVAEDYNKVAAMGLEDNIDVEVHPDISSSIPPEMKTEEALKEWDQTFLKPMELTSIY